MERQRRIDSGSERAPPSPVAADESQRRLDWPDQIKDRRDKLIATVGDLAGVRSIEQIVMILRRSARTIVGADGITIIRRERNRVHYIAEDAVGALWSGQDFPIEACVSGMAMLENQPIIIPDIYHDPRVPIEAYRATFVRSMAMFPIGNAAPRWAMGAYWSTRGAPDPDALTLLRSLARAAASCFESAERERRRPRT